MGSRAEMTLQEKQDIKMLVIETIAHDIQIKITSIVMVWGWQIKRPAMRWNSRYVFTLEKDRACAGMNSEYRQ